MKRWAAWTGRAASFLVLFAAAWTLHRIGFFRGVLAALERLGPWGPAVFFLVYVLTCVFFFPSVLFSFAGGFLFGIGPGIALSAAGNAVGSVLALLIGRYLARDWIEKRFMSKPQFSWVDAAVAQKGWKIVLLARLSPIFPFLIGNYIFGMTRIRAASYGLATLLGTLPSTSVYVYMGSVAETLFAVESATRERTPAEWALLAGGLVMTVVLALYLRRVAADSLKKDVPGA